ncbi:hypothetical protein BDY21DRAFT_290645, partial [Lineolata rhizophorae]
MQYGPTSGPPPPSYNVSQPGMPPPPTPSVNSPAPLYTQTPGQQGYPVEKQQYQSTAAPQVPQMAQPQQHMYQQIGQPSQTPQPAQSQVPQQIQNLLSSMPPEKLQLLQQQLMAPAASTPTPTQAQGGQSWASPPPPPAYVPPPTAAASGLSAVASTGGKPSGAPTDVKDQVKTGKVKRFMGDTLVGRFARASVQTATATLKMPAALSPWGDNNPVTLPNVRYRDAILFTTFAAVGTPLVEGADSLVTDIFGADSIVSEIVSSGAGVITGSCIVKYGVFQIIEQAIDKGILEHMLPEEEKMLTTMNVKSMQVGIKHKLMGVDADLRFAGVYPTANPQACEKGWFCPYLFASARTPLVPRANDFAIAQFFGPLVGADYALAHKLVAESAHVLAL